MALRRDGDGCATAKTVASQLAKYGKLRPEEQRTKQASALPQAGSKYAEASQRLEGATQKMASTSTPSISSRTNRTATELAKNVETTARVKSTRARAQLGHTGDFELCAK